MFLAQSGETEFDQQCLVGWPTMSSVLKHGWKCRTRHEVTIDNSVMLSNNVSYLGASHVAVLSVLSWPYHGLGPASRDQYKLMN